MDINNAYEVIRGKKPSPEDFVDLECPSCAEQFSSKDSGIYKLGDKNKTYYKNFVGKDFIEFNIDGRNKYTCPNRCTEGVLKSSPAKLFDIHEANSYTPHERYECALWTVRESELEDELEEVRRELRTFSNIDY